MAAERQPLTTATKRIVCVLQDVLRQESFESYADLTEALKCRLAQLKLPYRSDWIGEAIEQLERGGRQPVIRRQTPPPAPAHPTAPAVSREEAARLVRQLRARVQTMPKARPLTSRQVDRARALALITAAIDAQLDVCRAVEESRDHDAD
jgi:hypothetical protein